MNAITCVAASNDGQHVVTADSGPGSLLVLWYVRTRAAVRTVADPHANGCVAIAVDPAMRYIYTLSAPYTREGEDSGEIQEVR